MGINAASQHADFEGNGAHLDLLTFYLLKEKHFCGFSSYTSIYITECRSPCFKRSVLSKDFHYHLAISSVDYMCKIKCILFLNEYFCYEVFSFFVSCKEILWSILLDSENSSHSPPNHPISSFQKLAGMGKVFALLVNHIRTNLFALIFKDIQGEKGKWMFGYLLQS